MSKRVLVIDDEPDILKVIQKRLEAIGLEVITATDGEAGVHIIENENPDLIMLDVIIPGMDGFSVFKRIKTTPVICNIPVIIFSGRSAMAETFLAMGADSFIPKPVDGAQLVSEVKRLLKPRVMLLCEEPHVIEKVTTAFEKYDYEVCPVADEDLMLQKGREGKYKCVIAHLASIKTPPEQFGTTVTNSLNYKGPRLIVYSDANVKGLENNDTLVIEEVANKWKRAGSGTFYDSRIIRNPFPVLVKEWAS